MMTTQNASTPTLEKHTDISIVGSGMVGLTLAVALAQNTQQPLNITLIDINDIRAQNHYAQADGRCTALALGTLDIFDTLGVTPFLPVGTTQQHNTIDHIHVSARGRFGVSQLSATEFLTNDTADAAPTFGRVLHNHTIIQALLARIDQLNTLGACITLHTPATVTRSDKQTDGWTLHFADNSTLHTSQLVICDGARSPLRSLLGLPFQHHDYGFDAVACLVRCDKAHDNVAYERFLMPGTLALLPTGQHEFGCVWTMPREQATLLVSQSSAKQNAQLQKVFGWRCGKLHINTPLLRFPLHRIIAPTQSIPNTYILGNAAHNLHPVAGQGFNLSVRDAFSLSQIVLSDQACPDLSTSLSNTSNRPANRYDTARTNDQTLTNYFSHVLPKLFDQTLPFSDLARQAGLCVFDGLPVAAKTPFVNQAMGRV